ncbi:MAG TPA: nitroreductase family protein [Prolixibacteraceae bacterium]|nr:nitroreductase family protein [Prolixibacteraceae bacterium]
MEFDKLITSRFSVRSFTDQKVDRTTILEILEAARMAPSAVNFQPLHFVVITEPKNLTEIQKVYPRNWFREAPVCIVICSDHLQSWKRKSDGKDYADVDVAIAIDHLVLKATELGLGTCWVCNFDTGQAREKLQLPDHIEPVAIIPIGYTNSEAPVKTRKNLSELVHWEKFTDL